MELTLKNFTIITFIALMTIPFILITDIFPFLRFGMFAEPIRYEVQAETFITTSILNGKEEPFDPQNIGLDESVFSQLQRTYYYRNASSEFLQKLSFSSNHKHLRLYRVINNERKLVAECE